MVSGADSIVTWNGRDFPAEILGPLGIAVVTPDEMAASLLKDRPEEVCAAVRETRLSLKNPPKSIVEYLEVLTARGLKKTSALLASFHRDL